jgi:AraC family transcriptional regulator
MPELFQNSRDWHILHAVARRHHWRGEGWLSVKSFRGGRAHYSIGAGRHVVDDSSYLILNHGRNYSIEIDLPAPIESFCVFFAPEFSSDVFQNCAQSHAQLLDGNRNPLEVGFFEKTYHHDNVVSPLLSRLQTTHRTCDQSEIEEQMHHLTAALLQNHKSALREAEKLPFVRPSTRHELYRRVARARDFAVAMFDHPITLKDIARAAALSPNHLLRIFPQVYHQSPHQFLTSRRLAEAARLLSDTELPVTDVCFSVGFSSLGSFSSLFKRRFGLSPAQYRAANK